MKSRRRRWKPRVFRRRRRLPIVHTLRSHPILRFTSKYVTEIEDDAVFYKIPDAWDNTFYMCDPYKFFSASSWGTVANLRMGYGKYIISNVKTIVKHTYSEVRAYTFSGKGSLEVAKEFGESGIMPAEIPDTVSVTNTLEPCKPKFLFHRRSFNCENYRNGEVIKSIRYDKGDVANFTTSKYFSFNMLWYPGCRNTLDSIKISSPGNENLQDILFNMNGKRDLPFVYYAVEAPPVADSFNLNTVHVVTMKAKVYLYVTYVFSSRKLNELF